MTAIFSVSSGLLPEDVMLDIGGKIFGLKDTNVSRGSTGGKPSIRAVVPTSLLVSSRRIRAFRLFRAPRVPPAVNPRANCYDSTFELRSVDLDSSVEKAVLVSVASNGDATYYLYGNDLDAATVLIPAGYTLAQVDNVPLVRLAKLTIKKAELQTTKKLVLQKKNRERPILIDLPAPDSKKEPPKVTVDSPVILNSDVLEVAAERPGDLVAVKFGDKQLKFTKGKDTVMLSNLKADGVTTVQRVQELVFVYPDDVKVPVKIDVVAARIGIRH
jgi:hypothetical protein